MDIEALAADRAEGDSDDGGGDDDGGRTGGGGGGGVEEEHNGAILTRPVRRRTTLPNETKPIKRDMLCRINRKGKPEQMGVKKRPTRARSKALSKAPTRCT